MVIVVYRKWERRVLLRGNKRKWFKSRTIANTVFCIVRKVGGIMVGRNGLSTLMSSVTVDIFLRV